MARRRELADVADGVGGPFIRQVRFHNRELPLPVLWRAARKGLGRRYSFNLVSGTADPSSRELSKLGQDLARDLARLLRERRISVLWVESADMTVTVEGPLGWNYRRNTFVCIVTITDDLGILHTSTQTTPAPGPDFVALDPVGLAFGFLGALFRLR
ncbi:MAG TPA: hypothetical protein VFS93_00575 [Terrimesophilobacter sp.]|nr:hypothetical protein [Terrimesophilobacter sp.]